MTTPIQRQGVRRPPIDADLRKSEARALETRQKVAEAKVHRAPETEKTSDVAAKGALFSGPARITAKSTKRPSDAAKVQATNVGGPLFDAPLPLRRLPPLAEALRSKEVAAIAPAKLFPVPEAIVDRLDRAKKILVIGHVPPDGDCVGSALGLSRMLRALGKEAHACVDDAIPGNLRKMADAGELLRAAELHADYDLVVVVDVAANNRIGGAAKAVANAPEVLVIDHHQVDATHAELGMDPKTPLTTWVAGHVDSASLLVAGVNEHLASRHPEVKLDAKTRAKIALPLATGTYTDTDGFDRPGATLAALQGYKHLIKHELRGAQEEVDRVLDYKLPRFVREFLDARLAGKKRAPLAASPDLAKELAALQKKGVTLSAERAPDGSVALISCPRPVLDLALRAARRDDPATHMNDVRGHILNALDRLPSSHALAALLFETEKGDVLVSTRSPEPGPALELAKAVAEKLGGQGNGHLRMAGARPPAPLVATEPVVRKWMEQFRMERETKLRAAGNL